MMAALKFRVLCIFLAVVIASLSSASSGFASTSAPGWLPIAASEPTNLPPSGAGKIFIYTQNVGGASSTGTITVTDELPAGIVTSATPANPEDPSAWVCTAGAGQSVFSCTSTQNAAPGLIVKPIVVPVAVTSAVAATLLNRISVSSPGAVNGNYEQAIKVSSAPAKPGFQAFTAGAYDSDGTLSTQAGSHPYTATAAVFTNTVLAPSGKLTPAGDLKTVRGALPPGFLGNPTATVRCPEATIKDQECPIESQVGTVQAVIAVGLEAGVRPTVNPVHAVEAPIGYPAKFTFESGEPAPVFRVNVVGGVRSDEDYGLNVESPNTPEIEPVFGFFFNLWGDPSSPAHDAQRGGPSASGKAFLTQASDCLLQKEQPPFVGTALDTWLNPGEFQEANFPVPAVTGCNKLSLGVDDLTFRPGKETAATPSPFAFNLTLPQDGLTDPEKLATPPVKKSVLTLPRGVVINPSSADGLATCSSAQIGLRGTNFESPNHIRFTKASPECPDASKIGTVEVETELLDNPLPGTLYLASQDDNPFHSTLAIYLVIDDPSVGVILKLPGKVIPDSVTGQMTATFDDLPQLAFGELHLQFKGGEQAPLVTPDICDRATPSGMERATTQGEFTPWSAPESGPPTLSESSFSIEEGPDGSALCPETKAERPFRPTFEAGTSSVSAGAYSPFSFKVTRKDGEEELKGLEFTLPKGLTGKLAGIATCSAAAISAAEHVTGMMEQANPSCPSASQLGTVTSGAGFGSSPIYVGGKLYLAGPYKGAPLSAVAVIPAVAGPYDLGNVVSRAALYVDPVTAQLTAKTDPLPDILDGIPLALRSVKVNVDRSNFIINPTSCERMSIGAKVTGAGGNTVSSADDVIAPFNKPFQAGSCNELAFKPKLSARLSGGTHRNDHPALTAVVSYPPGAGYANTGYVQVALPHSEFLDQGHIDTVCTRLQFAADACPAGSIYGSAEAMTPLLDQPLTGPVYLRSSSNKLPDLVVALRGPDSQPIEVDLDGRIDSVHGGIRNTFELVPDAPVSKFTLSMKGGNKGLLVNSRNLCTGKTPHMTVRLIAQNNKRADQFPPLQNDCKKKARHKKHRLRR